MFIQNSEDIVGGVRCEVKNCQYHDGDCKCTAKEVKVGPGFANSAADTACSTFKPCAKRFFR